LKTIQANVKYLGTLLTLFRSTQGNCL